MDKILKLLHTWKTVFTKNDIEKILSFKTKNALDKFLYRAKKSDSLQHISRSIYVFWDYNFFELGCKLRKKSYISLETVLKTSGIIFQHYDYISLVGDDSRKIWVWWQEFIYSKIKDEILLNPLGIEHIWNYILASRERAICDKLYLSPWYYFDNLDEVDFNTLSEISQIYNTRVQKEIITLQKRYETQ